MTARGRSGATWWTPPSRNEAGMRTRPLLIFFSLGLLVLLSACATPAQPTTPPHTSETPMRPPTNTPPNTLPSTPGAVPEPFQPAQAYLADQLGLAQQQVKLKSSEPEQWPDSCLGLAKPGEMCLQVITPGYRAIFDTPQGEVEVHTNQSGKNFRVASLPGTQVPAVTLQSLAAEWHRTGGIAGICLNLQVDYHGAYRLENCKTQNLIRSGQLTNQQMSTLSGYINRFSQVTWESKPPAGSADIFQDSYTLYGVGNQTPTEDEKAEINQFLASVPNNPGGTPAVQGESGIQGQTLIGPACPGPVKVGSPCPDKPYQATLQVLTDSKKFVKEFQTDDQGHFQVALPPGTYILHPVISRTPPTATDLTVTVQNGQFTPVEIHYDSGIR